MLNIANILGFMQLDLQFRAEVFQIRSKKSLLPRHTKKFLVKEIQIKDATQDLKANKIEPLEYLDRVATAFINPKYYMVVQEATSKLFEDLSNENIIEDYLEIVFINEDSKKRLKIQSQKFYGNDWINE